MTKSIEGGVAYLIVSLGIRHKRLSFLHMNTDLNIN